MSEKTFYAHSPQDSRQDWELLSEHLESVATKAREFAQPFGFGNLAYISGLLHDIGKYQQSFQKRIRGANINIEHSICGAKEALELFAVNKTNPINIFDRELLAFIIAGHHSGLPDFGAKSDDETMPTLKGRLKRKCEDFYQYKDEINIFDENYTSSNWFDKFSHYENDEKPLAVALLARMLFSCLVDSDSLQTEKFYTRQDRQHNYDEFYILKQRLHTHLEQFSKCQNSTINQARQAIKNECFKKAESKKGLFSLTVPTGGGKTLSSMLFAINHLIQNGHRRIIYVMPYTAIISQTAKVFKKVFGQNNVLEHHSNFTYENTETKDEKTPQFLATENWDAPIILTTNVQFFESLFSSKRGTCRKLHNITNSVIVFDEAQMLPIKLLEPCLKTVDILTKNFGCSALLMSATYPDYKKYLCKNSNISELNTDYKKHYQIFKRVDAQYIGVKSDEEIASLIDKSLKTLVIVNSRKHAKNLFSLLPSDCSKYHLSTLLTPQHRKERLVSIQNDLNNDTPCVVVSTQLIECGVDMDFDVVYRSLAGIDSIVQAGGRCNREGKKQNAMMYVFEAADLDPKIGDIQIYKSFGRNLCEKPINDDILDLDNINKYFSDILAFANEKDSLGVRELFSLSKPIADKSISVLNFKFDQCEKKFSYIEHIDKYEIIIPLDSVASDLIDQVENGCATRKTFRKLAQYTVSIFQYEWKALLASGKIYRLADNDRLYVLCAANYYDMDLGLQISDSTESLII